MQTAPTPVTRQTSLSAIVAEAGTGAHEWAIRLRESHDPRDLTDAVHLTCAMHGVHPDLVECARSRRPDDRLIPWLDAGADAFAAERAALVALVAATGPLPSTPGHAQAEAAIAAQRHAIDMLAGSDRAGCAIGAAAALILDWPAVRLVLARAADRFGAPFAKGAPLPGEPPEPTDSRIERARVFGARQFLAQQQGLWSLLHARADARRSAMPPR